MAKDIKKEITESWKNRSGNVNTTPDILAWIKDLNANTCVNIEECDLEDCASWYYDEAAGKVVSKSGKFFSITGMRRVTDGEIAFEQPVIIQPEIGYLGILCANIDGVLNFLMQAKIEPGNVNCVQISPTIQATRSNFMRVHGGRTPDYLEIFANREGCTTVYDRTQSEQGSRFYRKRNRNIILKLDDDKVQDFEVGSRFKWMTLGQIKELMKEDNLVNMDTRTVLSGLPIEAGELGEGYLEKIYQKINDFRMFHDSYVEEIPLPELDGWDVSGHGVEYNGDADFMVRYYQIEIEGREVRKWDQPLFKAAGMATFGLISREKGGRTEYLIRLKPEIGCFDMAEWGPSVQWEPTKDPADDNAVDRFFREKIGSKTGIADEDVRGKAGADARDDKDADSGILTDVILSEEGGRFYHEQNRNLIIGIGEDELADIPDDYEWADLATLSHMIRNGSDANIQLRDLVSLIDF